MPITAELFAVSIFAAHTHPLLSISQSSNRTSSKQTELLAIREEHLMLAENPS